MTAISAVWRRRGGGSAIDQLGKMADALSVYGSDRQSTYHDGSVGFAVSQSHTLPEDLYDRQPEVVNGVVVVADIRLDNRDELRDAFELERGVAAVMPDSWLLRLAWSRWGTDCVRRLVGDFAFAIWSQAEQVLFCARDPLGLRSLYHATVGDVVAVATMPAGILALPGVSREIDPVGVTERLAMLAAEGGRTFFRGVSVLPPGHSLRVTATSVDVASYWRPQGREIRYRRDDDYVEHFREIFDEAVRCRLRANSPIASYLSSGLDSGAVSEVAARQLAKDNRDLLSVTWRPRRGGLVPEEPDRITDESADAARVAAQHPNVDHVTVEGIDRSPLELGSVLGASMGQPPRNPVLLPLLWATGERLRQRGCRVLLTGQRGNVTMSYDGSHLPSTLLRHGRLVAFIRDVTAEKPRSARRLLSAVYRGVLPLLPAPFSNALFGRGPLGGLEAFSALNPSFAESTGVRQRAVDEFRSLETDSVVLRLGMLRLMDLAAHTTAQMAVLGFEARDPTGDLRVVEYCLSIPDDQFRRAGQRRWLIRRAMRGRLPDATLDTRKRGLQASDWPSVIGPHRAEFGRLVDEIERTPLARAALDVPALRQLLAMWPERFTARHRPLYAAKLPNALTIGAFIRQFGSAEQRGT